MTKPSEDTAGELHAHHHTFFISRTAAVGNTPLLYRGWEAQMGGDLSPQGAIWQHPCAE